MGPQTPISWSGYEYEFQHKSPDWFWALGILAIAGAITALILGNTLFAIVILLGAFAMALIAVKRPVLTEFVINERGIGIGKKLYPFDTLESYWVREESPALLIKSKKLLMHHLTIPLENAPLAAIDAALASKIKKEEHHEPVAHRILEAVGF